MVGNQPSFSKEFSAHRVDNTDYLVPSSWLATPFISQEHKAMFSPTSHVNQIIGTDSPRNLEQQKVNTNLSFPRSLKAEVDDHARHVHDAAHVKTTTELSKPLSESPSTIGHGSIRTLNKILNIEPDLPFSGSPKAEVDDHGKHAHDAARVKTSTRLSKALPPQSPSTIGDDYVRNLKRLKVNSDLPFSESPKADIADHPKHVHDAAQVRTSTDFARDLKQLKVDTNLPFSESPKSDADDRAKHVQAADQVEASDGLSKPLAQSPSRIARSISRGSKKYPPPRKLANCVVERSFPKGCGRRTSTSLESYAETSEDAKTCSEARPDQSLDTDYDNQNMKESRKGEEDKDQNNFSLQKNAKRSEKYSKPGFNPSENGLDNHHTKDCSLILVEDKNRVHASRQDVKKVLALFHKIREWVLLQSSRVRHTANLNQEVAKYLSDNFKCVNTLKKFGPVPGIEIGDLFRWRAELAVIGLHHQFSVGIDYMKKGEKILAISIVASGRYGSDDVEDSDSLVYSGHGGNPKVTTNIDKPRDQILERENLALKNSIEAKNPIRVIRGIEAFPQLYGKMVPSSTEFRYIYDGLYYVERYWQERGQHGKLVFKFLLKRFQNQKKVPVSLSKDNISHQEICFDSFDP